MDGKIKWKREDNLDIEVTIGMWNASEMDINEKFRMFPYTIIDGKECYLEANIKK